MCFGNQTQDLAFIDGNSTVELLAVQHNGCADDEEQVKVFCFFRNGFYAFFSSNQKGTLHEQICTGIACDAQFRECQNTHAFCGCVFCHFDNLLFIIGTVCQSQTGNSCTDFYITKHKMFISLEFSEQADDFAKNGNVFYDDG